jgi:hypothetical protein
MLDKKTFSAGYLILIAIIILLTPKMILCSDGLIDFYFDLAMSVPSHPGSLAEHWESGAGLDLGIRIPFSVWKRYQQTWINLGYYDFPFNKRHDYPIIYPYSDEISYWGENTGVIMPFLNSIVFFRNEDHKHNFYFTFGIGYMKRSPTKIRSTSIDLPYIEKNFKGAGAFLSGIGYILPVKGHAYMPIELGYVRGNTFPEKTSFTTLKFGLLLK